jgi:hypothetical protein
MHCASRITHYTLVPLQCQCRDTHAYGCRTLHRQDSNMLLLLLLLCCFCLAVCMLLSCPPCPLLSPLAPVLPPCTQECHDSAPAGTWEALGVWKLQAVDGFHTMFLSLWDPQQRCYVPFPAWKWATDPLTRISAHK